MTSLQVVIDPDNFDSKTINGLNTGASIWVRALLLSLLAVVKKQKFLQMKLELLEILTQKNSKKQFYNQKNTP